MGKEYPPKVNNIYHQTKQVKYNSIKSDNVILVIKKKNPACYNKFMVSTGVSFRSLELEEGRKDHPNININLLFPVVYIF